MIHITARDRTRRTAIRREVPMQKVEQAKQAPQAKKIKLEIKRLEKVETTGLRNHG